jgi:large subunit ribosomal protein L17
MRHLNHYKKLNRTSSHRKAMLINIAVSLIQHEQIRTTLPKAKVLRPYVEKLVTIAKRGNGDLHSRRRLLSIVKDNIIAEKLINNLAKRYENRNGGYTRIMKAGFRFGDNAPMAVIEFVDREVVSSSEEKAASAE